MSTSAPFAFVPRKVARPSATKSVPLPPFPKPKLSTEGNANDEQHVQIVDKGKAKASESQKKTSLDEDIANLIAISLSNYSLWINPELRRQLDESLSKDEEDAGFLPLSDIISLAFVRQNLDKDVSETVISKALRSSTIDILEVRMLVSEPSRSTWYAQRKATKKEVGSYEVRRKDWQTMLEQPSRDFTRSQWNERTIYLENLPSRYRTIPGIARFIKGLFSDLGGKCPSMIQNIVLPPHHLDQPGDTPKCKGFGLVTLLYQDDCGALLKSWPWNRRLIPNDRGSVEGDECDEVIEARKFGLRVLTMAQWEKLNSEYVNYRHQLVDALIDSRSEQPEDQGDTTGVENDVSVQDQEYPQSSSGDSACLTTISSRYPLNCLVFVRNIHPETNKTTLRSLFITAFKTLSIENSAINYVDFTKGMDSCYLRLRSPIYSEILVKYFRDHLAVQTRGLDDVGRVPDASDNAIELELIQGKKEELYWDKVPEKVRKQAVEAMVKERDSLTNDTQIPDHGKRKKRKYDHRLTS